MSIFETLLTGKMRTLTTTFFTIGLITCVLAQSAGDFYRRAVMKYKDKDYASAIEEYSRAISIDSTSARTL